MSRLQEMRQYALFVDAINREVFKGGLGLNALENPHDISTIVTIQDKAISRLFLQDGIDRFEGVQKRRPGSFSEEMDSAERANAPEAVQLDPIDGTGDLNKSTHPDYAEFRRQNGITKPYGATNLVSMLERNSTSEGFVPTTGMIFDFVDEMVLLGDGETIDLYRIDNGRFISIPFKLRQREYKQGEPIRIGKRVAYPHEGFDKFLQYLKDEKKAELQIVTIGGAGRSAMQLFRTNMDADGPVPDDYKDTAIDVMFNAQTDHKTWDLDPTLAMYGPLRVTRPTDVYDKELTANASAPELKPGAWHQNGYLYSARGRVLHHLMAVWARDFERDTGYRVLDAKPSKT